MKYPIFLLAILSATAFAVDRPPEKIFAPGELPPKQNLHIYLLMGQSNMAGRGAVDAESQPNNPRILVFNRDGKWAIAADPLHWDKPVAGAGIGLSFAKAMAEAEPGATIGLVPCAVGGTPLSRWQSNGDLYKAAMVRAKAAAATGTLKGVLWHQGEADSNEKLAPTYAKRFEQMVKDLRSELGVSDLPVVAGELGDFYVKKVGAHGQTVNDALHAAAAALPRVAVADTKALKDKGDTTHFDTAALREFGRRYAKAMQALNAKTAKP